jgi:8-oxo-dGTP pyrophosphatase MutT (NUDIX family)
MKSRTSSVELRTLTAKGAIPRLQTAPNLQYAALPWRFTDKLEILLVTSRESKRWIIPKGWPIEGMSPASSAAQEAFEEAGVIGKISFKQIGAYHYFKRLKNGVTVPCKVDVFPLEVMRCRRDWPEKHERTLRWCSASEAATAVTESDLKLLIRRFARTHHGAGASVDGK